jgi:hypothetical protein
LRAAAVANLRNLLPDASTTGLGLLLSLRHEFPNEWSAFVNGMGDFTATLRGDHFPYLAQSRKISLRDLLLVLLNAQFEGAAA